VADWSLIRTQLETWVENRTGLPTHWNERPQGWINEDPGYVILRIISRRSVGHDSLDYVVDDTAPAGQEIQITQNGTRQFTLQAQVRTWRHTDDFDALNYTSLLRDSLCLPQASKAIFDVAKIDFATVVSEVQVNNTRDGVGEMIDGRDLSIANIDILFNAYSSIDDTPTGYVETINDLEFYDVDNPVPPIWTGDIEVT